MTFLRTTLLIIANNAACFASCTVKLMAFSKSSVYPNASVDVQRWSSCKIRNNCFKNCFLISRMICNLRKWDSEIFRQLQNDHKDLYSHHAFFAPFSHIQSITVGIVVFSHHTMFELLLYAFWTTSKLSLLSLRTILCIFNPLSVLH